MTTADDFPVAAAHRPLWLITLADLALLLVGFFVLLHANQNLDRAALMQGVRAAFGEPAPAPRPDPLPLAAAGMFNFAPGSARLPAAPGSLVAWAEEAARDPRVTLRITGAVDGSSADVDRATGSAAVLAADRARAVAATLAPVANGRIIILTADRPSRRQVVVTLSLTGETM